MKLKRKRFTMQEYDELIFYARRLCISLLCENMHIAKCYEQDILRIAEINYDHASSVNPIPEPRWCSRGYRHCAILWFVHNCIYHGSARYAKSELYALARRFIDWLYAECERDPSQDSHKIALHEIGLIGCDFDVVKKSVNH